MARRKTKRLTINNKQLFSLIETAPDSHLYSYTGVLYQCRSHSSLFLTLQPLPPPDSKSCDPTPERHLIRGKVGGRNFLVFGLDHLHEDLTAALCFLQT